MNRIDWIIVRRLAGSIGLTITVLCGLLVLVEAFSTSRFATLSRIGGPHVAVLAIAVAAARTIIDTLPLSVLIGAVTGLVNLQASREMTVIQASGMSIWRLMRGPVAATIAGAALVATVGHAAVVHLDRGFNASRSEAVTRAGSFWTEERVAGTHYIIEAGYVHPSGETLGTVSVFMLDPPRQRLEAETAELLDGEWRLPTATRFFANRVPEDLTDYRLPTARTGGDLRARLASVRDLTVFELAASLASRLSDPDIRARTWTRFATLIGMPVTLLGSLVVAFAFTAGYRRTNKYGATVLYGIVLGFVVFVLTEMAVRAGEAGVIQPVVAVLGPAVVAIMAGATVLLNKEDGRT
ncbi:LptF/LptG family permease [Devosia sp.]|uniref:LptF/LptG family permease n=1 Tax=Devosia sp. TaxID=1871048 RepID=UPI0035B0C48A